MSTAELNKGIALVITLAVLFGPITAALAEQPLELDDLVVTAGLEPISVSDIATSITVISREQIEERQVRYLADLLRDVPGFAVSQSGGPGAQTQIRIRGAEGNHVLVLMDGIRANDPASGDEFNFQYQSTANIERIEIVRGPQSAIWGTDALAGVINIIRRKDVNDSYIKGVAEYGSFDSLVVSADGGISRKAYTLTGGVSYTETRGINIAREGDEKDGAENTNANAMLQIRPAEDWNLLFSAQHVDARTEFDDFDFTGTGLPADADLVTEAERNYARGEARYEPKQSRWSGSLSVNWLDSDNENFRDGDWENSTAAETLEWRLRGSVLLGSQQDHRLTIALDREDVDFSQRGFATPWGNPNQDQEYDRTGYAAEYVATPFGGFTWTANARQDDFSDFDNAFTWQLAASHRFESGLKLRGSLGTGSKAPSFLERYGFFPDFFQGNPDLRPETSKGWEAGFDLPFAGHRYRIGAVYFDQQLEDEIDGFVFDPETFLFTAMNKEEKSDRKGVELVLNGQPLDSVGFNFSYTWLDATQTDMAGNSTREIRRPENMASFNLSYWFASRRGNLNLNVNYNGSQLDSYFPPPAFLPETVTLDSYTLVDVSASWKLSAQFEVTARISNLLDEDYEEVLGYSRPGTGFYAGLRGRFGD